MNVSPHFSWDELTRTSQTALQAENRAAAEQYRESLTRLAVELLEPIRAQFGPVRINSGFRSLAVNSAIGGSKKSQHMRGEAADIVAPSVSVEELHRWICAESGLAFGQCILEKSKPDRPFTWVHVSLGTKREALVYDGAGKYTPWRLK